MNILILALAVACADMTTFQMPGVGVTITKAEKVFNAIQKDRKLAAPVKKETAA